MIIAPLSFISLPYGQILLQASSSKTAQQVQQSCALCGGGCQEETIRQVTHCCENCYRKWRPRTSSPQIRPLLGNPVGHEKAGNRKELVFPALFSGHLRDTRPVIDCVQAGTPSQAPGIRNPLRSGNLFALPTCPHIKPQLVVLLKAKAATGRLFTETGAEALRYKPGHKLTLPEAAF